MIKSIPTVYRDVRFRSRLEARWATFFDLLGWEWEYEPFDMDGWIPDFLLTRPNMLVEVKPTTSLQDHDAVKIERAHRLTDTDREILYVGCSIPFKHVMRSQNHGPLWAVDCDLGCPIGALFSLPPSWRHDLDPDWGTAILSKMEFTDHEGDSTDCGWGLFSGLDPIMSADEGFRFGPEKAYDFARNRMGGGNPEKWGTWAPRPGSSPRINDLGIMRGPALSLWAEAGNSVQWRVPR